MTVQIPADRPDKALELLTAKNEDASEVARVEIRVPCPALTMPLEIVDTPGVNDIDTQREEITYGYLSRADAALMLLDLQQPLSASERRFLAEKVLANDVSKLLFVVNKVDQVTPEQRERALEYIRRQLAELPQIADAQVLPVASKSALKARIRCDKALLAESLFPEFEDALRAFLLEATGAERLATARARLGRIASTIQESLLRRETGLKGEQADLHASVEASRVRAANLLREQLRVEEDIRAALVGFGAACGDALDAELDGARAALDLVYHRPGFPDEASTAEMRRLLNEVLRSVVEIPGRRAAAVAVEIERVHGVTLASPESARGADHVGEGLTAKAASAVWSASVGTAVGSFVGGFLLGPFGAIPLAVLGGWVGSLVAPKPDTSALRTKAGRVLNDLAERGRESVERAATALEAELFERVVRPRQQALQVEHQTERALTRGLELDAVGREGCLRQAKALRERADNLVQQLEVS